MRAQIERDIFKQHPVQNEQEPHKIIKLLWQETPREYHYSACSLLQRNKKLWTEKTMSLAETMIRSHSWWDTVDMIASNIVGPLLLKYPSLLETMDAWINDENMWIRRSALLFQLKYKDKTNHLLLFEYCKKRMFEREFFICKAIGWALREYAKINHEAVITFTNQYKDHLAPLSYQQARKHCGN